MHRFTSQEPAENDDLSATPIYRNLAGSVVPSLPKPSKNPVLSESSRRYETLQEYVDSVQALVNSHTEVLQKKGKRCKRTVTQLTQCYLFATCFSIC